MKLSFINNIIMSSCNNNSTEIKPKTKEVTNEELLSKQPFYKQPIKKNT